MNLTRIEKRWASTALESIFPANVHPRVPGANVINGGESLEEVCVRVPFRVAMGLRIANFLFLISPLLVLFRFRTLGSLDAETRDRVVLGLLASPIYFVRQLALLLKAFGALMFIAAPGVRDTIVRGDDVISIGRKKSEVRDVA